LKFPKREFLKAKSVDRSLRVVRETWKLVSRTGDSYTALIAKGELFKGKSFVPSVSVLGKKREGEDVG